MSGSISSSKAPTGVRIGFTQIAGLVARRILTFVSEGDQVEAGERVGLIRFGSRVDVYLPAGTGLACCSASARSPARPSSAELGVDRSWSGSASDADRRSRSGTAFRFRAMVPNAITAARALLRPDRRQPRDRRRMGEGARLRSSSPACSTASTGASPGCCGRRASSAPSSTRCSDNIAFGTAPALILFLWSLQTAPRFGWIAALALAVCCALRLARFNARIDVAEQPHKSAGFNTGVPAPAGAGLAFVPIFCG